jgi:hypothetical protein
MLLASRSGLPAKARRSANPQGLANRRGRLLLQLAPPPGDLQPLNAASASPPPPAALPPPRFWCARSAAASSARTRRTTAGSARVTPIRGASSGTSYCGGEIVATAAARAPLCSAPARRSRLGPNETARLLVTREWLRRPGRGRSAYSHHSSPVVAGVASASVAPGSRNRRCRARAPSGRTTTRGSPRPPAGAASRAGGREGAPR